MTLYEDYLAQQCHYWKAETPAKLLIAPPETQHSMYQAVLDLAKLMSAAVQDLENEILALRTEIASIKRGGESE